MKNGQSTHQQAWYWVCLKSNVYQSLQIRTLIIHYKIICYLLYYEQTQTQLFRGHLKISQFCKNGFLWRVGGFQFAISENFGNFGYRNKKKTLILRFITPERVFLGLKYKYLSCDACSHFYLIKSQMKLYLFKIIVAFEMARLLLSKDTKGLHHQSEFVSDDLRTSP